jgi:tRNA pseudouridine38-40 synthase
MRNIKLVIEYDGTNYHGWQVQPNGLTIQEVLQEKIAVMTRHPVHVAASGRTDAGVHAWGQVANFLTASSIPLEGFLHGLNSLLPPDIVIQTVEEAPPEFHAQFSAKRKTYRYQIVNSKVPSAMYRRYAWFVRSPLELSAMQEACGGLLGRRDFSSFQGADADTLDPVREVFKAEWARESPSLLAFVIQGNGFLKRMVRNLVGTLVEVGKGKMSGEEFGGILEARDRRRAGITAPPQGLFLVKVEYGR